MWRTARIVGGLWILAAAGACSLQPDPPPQIDRSAYGGTGDRMAACMEYGSESYCEREVWGGNVN